MIAYFGRIFLAALLATVGVWGLYTGIKRRKLPTSEMRFYGIYLRVGLVVGGLACIASAVVLMLKVLGG